MTLIDYFRNISLTSSLDNLMIEKTLNIKL